MLSLSMLADSNPCTAASIPCREGGVEAGGKGARELDFLEAAICVLTTIHLVGQITKLKEDFSAVQRQNTNLQHQNANLEKKNISLQQLHERIAVRTGGGAQMAMPQKRRRVQEEEDLDNPPYKQTDSDGFSREQIRDVLGGSDRGWCSTRYVYISPSHTPPSFVESSVKGVVPASSTCTTFFSM